MARPLRIQFPGAIYHVTCRGNERRGIFKGESDRKKFLTILTRSLEVYSVRLYAYVLMNNHFHLLVETPLGNLAEFMRHFNITYTSFFNRRYSREGHLYQGRYKSILVEKESYLAILSRYIHLNPMRVEHLRTATPSRKEKELLRYPWSSLPGYIDLKRRQEMIDYSQVLADYGGDTSRGRATYHQQLLADLGAPPEVKNHIFCQAIIGGKDFISWVTDNFLDPKRSVEQPSVNKIWRYHGKKTILSLIEKETSKTVDILKKEKGDLRRLTMELLYQYGGLKGPEIGELFGIGYSAVSQERKRLQQRLANKELAELKRRLETKLSTIKI